ncbi:Sulfite efflux pump SSU1 [Lasiodiplodia theobromae]|uniref:Sulfite efflux pump SSU1 n=1 Tax=Lasiodiplodia theobromae TaxID=45133 RepID=A0A5N5D0P4_9PEZI|nr:Sulfite efflux pump SSU1 [Lasiodiplodia theobromae]
MGAQEQDPETSSRTSSRRRIPQIKDYKFRDQQQEKQDQEIQLQKSRSQRQNDDQPQYGDNNPACVPPASMSMRPPSRPVRTVSVSTPSGESKHVKENESNDDRYSKRDKYNVGWRRVVRNFSPSWFSVTMGTGIVANLLEGMPYNGAWLYWLSIVFFVLNTILFTLALATSIVRYTLYPEIWGVMIRDPINSLFLGTIPMGFATLIEMWVLVCVPAWGPWAATFAWVLWMIDTVVAAAVTLSLSVLLMMQTHELKSLERFTAAQLLPIAATIVAAGTGARVAEILPDPQWALGTIMTSYVLWAMGTPLAFVVIAMYYQRLAVHKMPPREVIVSCFLPLGPLGFGGFGIMYLGKVSRDIFPLTDTLDPTAGSVFYVLGFLIALIMWGFGLVWFFIALVSIWEARPFPFNMGWWGFTFPLGVFATSTIQIGVEMPSRFFKVLGQVFSVAVILLWCLVAARTAKGAWTGKLFFAPCLANLKKDGEDGGNAGGGREEEERA